jgi:hypothetical protein
MNQPRTQQLPHPHRLALALALAALTLIGSARAGDDSDAEAIEYNRDIRPILSENCFACHGPDSAARKADLRLDQRAAAVELGAIVPNDPEASGLIERITTDDKSMRMPPRSSNKTLNARQIDLLRRWVAAGAEYQPHWSLIAPTRPAPPAVKNEAWIRNPIDRFVLALLEKNRLAPAPEADRRTLARRLSLDLTGLPPEPAVVEAFVNDRAPDAYEQLVDRLMATPEWGEHRARYWLDAARYADTHGIHFDNYRENWAYRDWVIAAFNRNLPFDQFTLEQLAGDLLPGATLEQQVASGFNRCNITTNEGGIIDEEYLVLYTRDRTETTGQVWLGLTAGCAVCHDHKFDPLTQKQFYEMAAFFNNNEQNAKDGNIKDTPPTVFVPGAMDRERWGVLSGLLADARQQLDTRKKAARPEFDKWLAQAKPKALAALDLNRGQRLKTPLGDWEAKAHAGEPLEALEVADAGNFESDQAFSYGAWIKLAKAGATGAIVARMDDRDGGYRGWDLWLDKGRLATHIIHKWPDEAIRVTDITALKADQWYHVLVTYDGSGEDKGVALYLDGRRQTGARTQTNNLRGTIRTEVPFKVGQRHTASQLDGALIGGVRLFDRALLPREVEQIIGYDRALQVVAKAPDARTKAEADVLFPWWLSAVDGPGREMVARLTPLEQEEADMKPRGTFAHVMHERAESAMAYILYRGEYDKRRDEVHPDTPDALPAFPSDLPRNRLGFAQWLLRPENPLPARVTVNRFWQELFGTGLVRTAGDFGVAGELPSHPELLDWLAVEFRDGGWDVKAFFKLLVTSATYRQSAALTPQKREKDAQNRLLSRGPRFRMDAEMVRDYALSAGGLLEEKLGGPSVKPYQPDGVWEAVAMIGSNTRNYERDTGDKLYRRSLYTFWKRAAPPASMDIFNAPSREVCTVRRERTNTPLQALVTLNDPQFVEAARNLAERTLKEGGETDATRLAFLAARLVARPLRPEESRVAEDSLAGLLAYYRDHAKDAAELVAVGESKAEAALDVPTLAAWTMLSNELMNLDEVLNK